MADTVIGGSLFQDKYRGSRNEGGAWYALVDYVTVYVRDDVWFTLRM